MTKALLRAYHGDFATKTAIITKLREHRRADKFEQGTYGEGRGSNACGVGCTVGGNYHSDYEMYFGFPHELARVEDGLFELMESKDDYASWPVRLMAAAEPGADLTNVYRDFLIKLLSRPRCLSNAANAHQSVTLATITKFVKQWRTRSWSVAKAIKQCDKLRLIEAELEELNRVADQSSMLARSSDFYFISFLIDICNTMRSYISCSTTFVPYVADDLMLFVARLHATPADFALGFTAVTRRVQTEAVTMSRHLLKLIKAQPGRRLSKTQAANSMAAAAKLIPR